MGTSKLKRMKDLMVSVALVCMFLLWTVSVDDVYAKESANKVKFVVNGGKFTADKYRNKKSIIKKADGESGYYILNFPKVKRKGYHLLGWYTKKKGGKYCEEYNRFYKNTTLYARWEKPYKIQQKYMKLFQKNDYDSIEEIERIVGKLYLVKADENEFFGDTIYETKNQDRYHISSNVYKNKVYYCIWDIQVKAKNLLNIRKATNIKKFCMKLNSREYNQKKIKGSNLYEVEVLLDWVPFIQPDEYYGNCVYGAFLLKKDKKIKPNTFIRLGGETDWYGEKNAY